jgi:hypothetical protein
MDFGGVNIFVIVGLAFAALFLPDILRSFGSQIGLILVIIAIFAAAVFLFGDLFAL